MFCVGLLVTSWYQPGNPLPYPDAWLRQAAGHSRRRSAQCWHGRGAAPCSECEPEYQRFVSERALRGRLRLPAGRSRASWTSTPAPGWNRRCVGDDGRGDAAADVALHQGLAELDAEDLCRVDPAVDAGDDVQVQARDERQPGHALARAGIAGEGPVAVQERGDVRHSFAFVVEAA
jgi:hypothetical protein